MSASFGRRLAWAGLAMLATFVLFFGGAWLGLYLTDLRIVTVAAAGVLLAAWAVVAWRNPMWRPRSVLLRKSVRAFPGIERASKRQFFDHIFCTS